MANIYEKLQKARIMLQEMKLKKSGKNSYAGFSYYELSDFLPHINKIFFDLNLFSKFDLLEEKATLTIIYTEKDSLSTIVFETNKTEAILKGTTAIQQLGATHTYLKRYLYLNALEIIENDFVDATIDKEKQGNKKEVTFESVISYITKHEKECQQEIKDFLVENSLIDLTELKFDTAKTLATKIREKVGKKNE